ncbi:NUDIX domain-containing protein [Terrihabitans sp. B22-R8]|uniref:NUDIX domain-containing protein n=1 Tax=Terrihabitans sp. B22-R8 TaxID=3425128 RepID=UPI00403CED28
MKRALYSLLRPVAAPLWLMTRGLTMGVRGAVLDSDARVMLVKHSYVDGWHLPGGGVEVGETAENSLRRELAEEANVTVTGTPLLHGLFFHPGFSRRDHVAVYVVRDFTWNGPRPPDGEIVASEFFPLDRLPEDTTPATRRRLAEILQNEPQSAVW